jgi:hypothetical protein
MKLEILLPMSVKASTVTDEWFKWLENKITTEERCLVSVHFNQDFKEVIVSTESFAYLYLYYIESICKIVPLSVKWR